MQKNGEIRLMEKQFLIKTAGDFIENSQDNYITKEMAISDNVVGMRISEEWLHGRIEGQS
jgi:hypothetical protein